MTRGSARELLMQLLFQMEMQQDFSDELKDSYLENVAGVRNQLDYINTIFTKVTDNLQLIDDVIDNNSEKWKVTRMPKVDKAILRLAIAEMLFAEDIPCEVSINEAVNLAKKFSTDESGKFINGILSKVI